MEVRKRVLQCIGHVLRKENDRPTKAAVFGWLTDLEQHAKQRGKFRKTTFNWKQLISDSRWDRKNIDDKAKDRHLGKKLVKKKVRHLKTWGRNKGIECPSTMMERNAAQQA